MATPIPENGARLSAAEVAVATGGECLRGEAIVATGFTTDSRAVRPGGAFVPIRGAAVDGHSFLEAAGARGAALLVCERGRSLALSSAAVVLVDDTLDAWGKIAGAHLLRWRRARPGLPPARVVAVTGSAGKTTTKELVAGLLGQVGACHKTRGNLNNRIGMPAVVLAVESGDAYAVLELGMSVPGEIAAMASVCRPDVGIVTNIGVAHSEGVGGREGVAREKGALFEALGPGGVAVLSADCDLSSREVRRARGARSVTFGKAEGADYRLVAREVKGIRGSVVRLRRPGASGEGEELSLPFPLLGEHAVIDLLAALAAAEAASGRPFSPEQIVQGVVEAELSGRGTLVALGNGALVVDDSYNANPASMRAGLATLIELARPGKSGEPAEPGSRRRRIAVLGEMKELGPLAEAEHDALGDALAAASLDLVVGCGGLMDRALERAAALGVPTFCASSAEEAATYVTSLVVSGDILLVKGSRSVSTEKVVLALVREHGLFEGGAP